MRLRIALPLLGGLTLAACQDTVPTANRPPDPPTGPAARPVHLQELVCRGDLATETLACAPPDSAVATLDLIVGGQNVYVRLTSSGVAYNSGTGQFTFTTTVQNLIPQPLGTADGAAPDVNGVRVFFQDGPAVTGGTGTASVVPDGFATFTAAGQAFYQYNEILWQNDVSAGRTWTLVMPPTVTTFEFHVLVSAAVPFPDGYISVDGGLPGFYAGNFHPGNPHQLTAASKTVVGNTIPGTTITFSSEDPLCAAVDAGGLLTPLRASNCDIEATDGTRTGYVNLTVTGTTRVWDGSASADWANGANWAGDLVPAEEDSVYVPASAGNYPQLDAARTVEGITVEDAATLSLGAFDLRANANVVSAATTGGILSTTGRLVLGGADKLVRGRLPQVLVVGAYALDADVTAVATQQVDAGELLNPGFALNVDSQ